MVILVLGFGGVTLFLIAGGMNQGCVLCDVRTPTQVAELRATFTWTSRPQTSRNTATARLTTSVTQPITPSRTLTRSFTSTSPPTPTPRRLATRTDTPEPQVQCERDETGFVIEQRIDSKIALRFRIRCMNPFETGRELDLGILIVVLPNRDPIGQVRFEDTQIAAKAVNKSFTSAGYEITDAPPGAYLARVRYKGNNNKDLTIEIPFP